MELPDSTEQIFLTEINKRIEKLKSDQQMNQRDISLEDNKMRKITMDMLLKMRKEFLDNNTISRVDLCIKEEDFLQKIEKETYVIISGVAGIGKSTLMKSIQKRYLNQDILSWVHFVDLKKYVEDFEDIQEVVDFPEFFKKHIMHEYKEHEKLIFDHFYNYHNVVVLFDGFDEISPKYGESVLKIIKSFKAPNGILIISTRPHLAIDLKETLNVKDIFSLKTVTENEQKQYLLKYLETRKVPGDHSEIAEILFDHYSMIVSKNFNFVGPMQLIRILAEASLDKGKFSKILLSKLTSYKIFKKILEFFFEIWCTTKGELGCEANVRSHFGMNFYGIHKILAMKCFEDKEEFCGEAWNTQEWTEEEICRCGFIQGFENGMPIFIDEIYKDIFAACFIIDHLSTKNEEFPFLEELFG